MRSHAANWRNVGALLVVVTGIGSLVFAVNAAQTASIFDESDFNGGVFIVTLGIAFGSAMVVIWPYFMFAQTMEALGALLDRPTDAAAPKPIRRIRPKGAAETGSGPAASPTVPATPSGEPSQRGLDIREYLGDFGPTGAPQIGKGIGHYFGVIEELNDLVARGMVVQSAGRYERVDVPRPGPPPRPPQVAATEPENDAVEPSSVGSQQTVSSTACQHCGATLKAGHRFCSACGKAVSGS